MISFGAASNKNKDPDKEARLAGIRQISDWVENELPEDEQETTSVMVNQIECAEEGCPPVECVIALLRKPKLVFKIFKPVVEVTQPEVLAGLKAALAKEAAELKAEHGHDHSGHAKAEHGHAEATSNSGEHGDEHGHEHGGDCCGHDHAHEEHKDEHEHGHADKHSKDEHAEHGHADKHSKGEHEHGHAEKADEHEHAHEGDCCGHDHGHEEKAEHAHGHQD